MTELLPFTPFDVHLYYKFDVLIFVLQLQEQDVAAAKSLRAAFTKVNLCFVTVAVMFCLQLMVKIHYHFIVIIKFLVVVFQVGLAIRLQMYIVWQDDIVTKLIKHIELNTVIA